MRIVCIGAAPTGLGAAYRLNELIEEKQLAAEDVEMTILEKESYPGGLSCTVKDDKGFLWDMGGHITFNHNFPYYEKAVKWAVDEWNSLQRNCMVDMNYLYDTDGIHLVPYPAQFAVPLFPDDVKQNCLNDLRQRYEQDSNGTPENFDDWVMRHFGPTILDVFFKPYTKKVWTVEPCKMSSNWVGTRVAKLPQEKLEELCMMNKSELANADFGWGPNSFFTFPRYGGTGNVWSSMTKKLPKKWFKFNSEVVEINPVAKCLRYQLKDSKEIYDIDYDVLLSAAPIDLLIKKTNLCQELNLEYNKVFIVGIGLKKPMTDFLEKFTWLYFPDPNVPFFRVTILSRYGEVTPDNSRYWSIMCECARSVDDTVTEEEIVKKAIDGLVIKSLIHREKIVSIYSTTLPYGYPIPTVTRDYELARAHRDLEKYSIYSRGRFGGWKYEVSNQDHCFMQGKEFIDRVILGEPEKLYRTGLAEKRG
ncbi:amine oxidase family protein [Dictyocaulus viviparus]|uniref:Amine oxidase family protein n=1 Tax=Dictyocaulus viviparus TaxID=29172 RepID=A0A0D8XCC5_DICVI|nr:amine oxidase family protein [Dictyocaulus viviparus]